MPTNRITGEPGTDPQTEQRLASAKAYQVSKGKLTDSERIAKAVELLRHVKLTSFPNVIMLRGAADLITGNRFAIDERADCEKRLAQKD